MNAEPELLERTLGKTGGAIQLKGQIALRAASALMAAQATRRVRIMSRDMDAALYDRLDFLDSVRRLALTHPRSPVQILVYDAGTAARSGHRLIELARQISSRIAIRRIPAEFHHQPRAYLLVDESGYVLRHQPDLFEGTADFSAPTAVRRMLAEFEQHWDRSDEPSELRTFARGL